MLEVWENGMLVVQGLLRGQMMSESTAYKEDSLSHEGIKMMLHVAIKLYTRHD